MQTETLHPCAPALQATFRPKLMGITQSSFDPASWFRFVQLIPYLEKAGWQVDHRPNRPDRQWQSPLRSPLARALHYRMGRALMRWNRLRDLWDSRPCDAAFINRDLAGEGPLMQKLFRPLVERSVYDFDDAIFVGPRERQVRWMCANSCWVTPGNEYLAKYARRFTDRVTIIPTVIDTDLCRARSYEGAKTEGPVRVGWSGSDQSIGVTLVPNLPMLRALQKQVDFELVVITNTKPELAVPDLRWTFVPWRREDEPLLESKFDIGIMPLVDDAFQKGKCALKLLQYMAAGLPTVASPVGVNAEVVRPGATGMLATTEAEWHQALSRLILDPQARAAQGRGGRDLCVKEYSIRRWLPVLLGILETVRHETGAAKKRDL